LIDGSFAEADGVDGDCSDPLFSADKSELAQDGDECRWKRFEAKVRKPEAEVKLVCHADSVQARPEESRRGEG